jgi:hypothetical protein
MNVSKGHSMKQVSATHGIPIQHLKYIKEHFPEGFTASNKVILEKVLKYYEDNKTLIVQGAEEKNQDALKRERTKNVQKQNVLLDIQIEEAKKQTVNIKDVETFMANFGVQLSAVLKNALTKELPPRIVGLSQEDVTRICKEYYNEVLELFSKNMDEWNDQAAKG